MDIVCNSDELNILQKIAHAAKELNYPTYLIGGFVRDRILNRPCKDIDVVCIGDGIELAKASAQLLGAGKVNFFKNFGNFSVVRLFVIFNIHRFFFTKH